jgi:hypothetical protein
MLTMSGLIYSKPKGIPAAAAKAFAAANARVNYDHNIVADWDAAVSARVAELRKSGAKGRDLQARAVRDVVKANPTLHREFLATRNRRAR